RRPDPGMTDVTPPVQPHLGREESMTTPLPGHRKGDEPMADAPADVAASYFARLRTILADDVTFDGPLGHAANAEECIAGLRRMSEIVTDIVIRKTFI